MGAHLHRAIRFELYVQQIAFWWPIILTTMYNSDIRHPLKNAIMSYTYTVLDRFMRYAQIDTQSDPHSKK